TSPTPTAKPKPSPLRALGPRVGANEMAKMILDAFFGTEFEGGRHAERVQKICDIEAKYSK
ncbi:MAG: RpiB/LacA/LacB family sugar-phosphate isomerase, partial [Lachnospiraceae bacterium]